MFEFQFELVLHFELKFDVEFEKEFKLRFEFEFEFEFESELACALGFQALTFEPRISSQRSHIRPGTHSGGRPEAPGRDPPKKLQQE